MIKEFLVTTRTIIPKEAKNTIIAFLNRMSPEKTLKQVYDETAKYMNDEKGLKLPPMKFGNDHKLKLKDIIELSEPKD